MKLSDIKKLYKNGENQKALRSPIQVPKVSRDQIKPILYWDTPFIDQNPEKRTERDWKKFLVKNAFAQNANISSILLRKTMRVKTLAKHTKFMKCCRYESLPGTELRIKQLGLAQGHSKRLKTIELQGGSLFRIKNFLPKVTSPALKEILIDDYIMKDLRNHIFIMRHLKNHRRLEQVSLLKHNYKSRIGNMEVSKKLENVTRNNLKRLPKLKCIKIHLPTCDMEPRLCSRFSSVIGKLPFLRLYANFRFEKDSKIVGFLEGLRGNVLELLDVSWGFQTNEEISKRLGELVGIKRLAFNFREEMPPKLMRNIRKIKNIEEFSWSVNCDKMFYSSAETIIKGNMGLVEAVVHYKQLKYLDIDVYQSGPEVYKLLGTGLSDMKVLKTLKLNFPYHAPNVSLSAFFNNFTNPVVRSVKFSLEVGHEEEMRSLGICLRKLSRSLKHVSLHFHSDIRTEHAAELYQHLKLLDTIESLEMVYSSVIKGKGKPSICEMIEPLKSIKNINLSLGKMFSENEIEPLLKTLSRVKNLERFQLTNQIAKLKNTTINLMQGFARKMPDSLSKLEILFPEARYNFHWKKF